MVSTSTCISFSLTFIVIMDVAQDGGGRMWMIFRGLGMGVEGMDGLMVWTWDNKSVVGVCGLGDNNCKY